MGKEKREFWFTVLGLFLFVGAVSYFYNTGQNDAISFQQYLEESSPTAQVVNFQNVPAQAQGLDIFTQRAGERNFNDLERSFVAALKTVARQSPTEVTGNIVSRFTTREANNFGKKLFGEGVGSPAESNMNYNLFIYDLKRKT